MGRASAPLVTLGRRGCASSLSAASSCGRLGAVPGVATGRCSDGAPSAGATLVVVLVQRQLRPLAVPGVQAAGHGPVACTRGTIHGGRRRPLSWDASRAAKCCSRLGRSSVGASLRAAVGGGKCSLGTAVAVTAVPVPRFVCAKCVPLRCSWGSCHGGGRCPFSWDASRAAKCRGRLVRSRAGSSRRAAVGWGDTRSLSRHSNSCGSSVCLAVAGSCGAQAASPPQHRWCQIASRATVARPLPARRSAAAAQAVPGREVCREVRGTIN